VDHDLAPERITWRFADPAHALVGVRLQQHAGLDRERLDFTPDDEGWVLSVPRPPIDRIEYLLELTHADGRVHTVRDPANPLGAAGVFGQPSLLELPGYVPPSWLSADSGDWTRTDLQARGRGIRDVPVQLCSPAGVDPREPLPLLVAHDGGEMDALARLTTYAAATVARGAVPPYRIALLSPLDRDNWYSGSPAYGRTLATSVLPLLRFEVRVEGPIVGLGASLGALSLLTTQLRYPRAFGGLFLESGSFFHPTDDPQEEGFRRYWRIVNQVTDLLQGGLATPEAPELRIGVVCGTVEENLANNRRMATALTEQGHRVSFAEFRDAHNFTAWRDALDPHLTAVLADAWG
jgi:enterochelin esterase-like enzyme